MHVNINTNINLILRSSHSVILTYRFIENAMTYNESVAQQLLHNLKMYPYIILKLHKKNEHSGGSINRAV